MWSSKIGGDTRKVPNEQRELRAAKESVTHEWKSTLMLQRVGGDNKIHFQNVALSYASQMIRSESARLNGTLMNDYALLLGGNAVYIRNFLCNADDFQLYDKLKDELVEATGAVLDGGLIEWSKHQAFENPSDMSATFNDVVDMLSDYFDVDVYATRLNYYRDGTQWKPQHHDSHAYGGRSEREDFTAGITLGSDRSLVFVHVESGQEFTFPQNNGDCFAFTGDVNTQFTHGVPRVSSPVGDRFSIIVWGRRRTINERNGGGTHSESMKKLENQKIDTIDDAIKAAHELVSSENTKPLAPAAANREPSKKKKNRLQ